MKTFSNGLTIVEPEDVLKLYNQLTPWDKRDVVREIAFSTEPFKDNEDALNYFGYELPSIRDYSAFEVCSEFYAEDLLDEMARWEIVDYVNRDPSIQDEVLDDVGNNYMIEYMFDNAKTDEAKKKIFDYIAETYNEEFMEWLHGTNYYRTEEEWKAFENSIGKKETK